MKQRLILTSFFVLLTVTPLFGATTTTSTFPSDGYVQEETIYTGAANQTNLGVTENTKTNPVVANPWYDIDPGYYLPKNTAYVQQCPTGKYCTGVSAVTLSSTTDQGATGCPTNWSSDAGATTQLACKRDVALNKNGGTLVSGKTLATSKSCNYNQSCSFPATSGVITESGYTFNNKWSTNSNCSDGGATSAQVTSTNSSVTYYACKVGVTSGQITVQYEVDSGPAPSGFTNPYPNGLYTKYGTGIYASLSDANNGTNALTSLAVPELACHVFVDYTAIVNSNEVRVANSDGSFVGDNIKKLGNSAAGTGSTIFGRYEHYPVVSLDVQGRTVQSLTADFNSVYKDSACATPLSAGASVGVPSTPGYTFGGYYCKGYGNAAQGAPSDIQSYCNGLDSANSGLGTEFVDANGKITQAGLNSVDALDCGFLMSLTCEAKLTPKTYTITFNNNGGNGGQSGTKTVTFAAAMPSISTTAPTKTGYKFAGWYDTNATEGGNMYYKADGTSAKTWDKTTDTTLYARWEAGVIYIKWTGVMPSVGLTDSSQSVDGESAIADNNGVLMSRVVYGGSISTPIMADGAPTGQKFLGWKFVKPAN